MSVGVARRARWGARGSTLVALLAAAAGCHVPPEMLEETDTTPGTIQELPPPGYGTLRQDEVSIALTSGSLRLLVTPLGESVTRVTAPDTYQRLSGLAASYRSTHGDSHLFLVSLFSDEPDVRFVPEEIQLVAKGLRVRPSRIVPVTPTWGERRLRQRETEMAIYAFDDEVDLESELVLAYGLDQTSSWTVTLTRVQAERARAWARSRGRR